MYDVYVGNLSNRVTDEILKDFFRSVGEITAVYVKSSKQTLNYGFVCFRYLNDAFKACNMLNNIIIDGLVIKVNLSIKTQQKLKNNSRKRMHLR